MLRILKQTKNALLIISGFALVLFGISGDTSDSMTDSASIGVAHADAPPSCTSSGEGCGGGGSSDSGCGSDCGGAGGGSDSGCGGDAGF